MKWRKIALIIIAAITVIGGLSGYLIHNKIEDQTFFTESAELIIDRIIMSDYIEEVEYLDASITINYKILFTDKFAELCSFEQYSLFYRFSKQLKLNMLYSDGMGKRIYQNIYINGVSMDQSETYHFEAENNNLRNSKINGELFVNGDLAYTYQQFLNALNNYEVTLKESYINGYSDKEIYGYALRMFDLITVGRSDVDIYHDYDLVRNIVMEDYDLTEEQYFEVCNKYFMLMD